MKSRLLAVCLLVLLAGCAAQSARDDVNAELAGTNWQLVRFEGGDDTVLVPADGARYTLSFAADGRVAVRFDCNHGTGTWNSAGPSRLEFGPLMLTRALCPPGSLHDRIVTHWPYVRSYVLRDGRLYLSLFADGGIYEFKPACHESSFPATMARQVPIRYHVIHE